MSKNSSSGTNKTLALGILLGVVTGVLTGVASGFVIEKYKSKQSKRKYKSEKQSRKLQSHDRKIINYVDKIIIDATESKPEISQESKPEIIQEPKPEISQESKPEIVKESKPEISQESKIEIIQESKIEIIQEPKPEIIQESKIEIIQGPEIIQKPKPEIIQESKPEIIQEPKLEITQRPKLEIIQEPKPKLEIVQQLQQETHTTEQIESNDLSVDSQHTMSHPHKKVLMIKNIDKAPLELRKRFSNKGFVIVSDNLATINTELNEFVELMRRYGLNILDGCKEPTTCKCSFRHKRCRLFMVRNYSDHPEPQFYVPTCSGVTHISPSNKDVKDGTMIHEFVQLFQNKFYDRITDLINYVSYLTDPNRTHQFVVDATLIADPHDEYYKYEPADGGSYGYPNNLNNDKKLNNDEIDNKSNNDSDIDRHKCKTNWHQDLFREAKTNKMHAYDIVAMFLLNAHNLTSHSLIIGKPKNDQLDLSNQPCQMTILSDTIIDNNTFSDIGYIIDQRKNIYHKHSDFEYKNRDARRNIITIRLKYLK